MPVAFLIGGWLTHRAPGLSLLFLGVAVLTCLSVAVWLALGAEKFQSSA